MTSNNKKDQDEKEKRIKENLEFEEQIKKDSELMLSMQKMVNFNVDKIREAEKFIETKNSKDSLLETFITQICNEKIIGTSNGVAGEEVSSSSFLLLGGFRCWIGDMDKIYIADSSMTVEIKFSCTGVIKNPGTFFMLCRMSEDNLNKLQEKLKIKDRIPQAILLEKLMYTFEIFDTVEELILDYESGDLFN